jgi:hypothetical protein
VPKKKKIRTDPDGRIDLGGWECQGQTDLIDALAEEEEQE